MKIFYLCLYFWVSTYSTGIWEHALYDFCPLIFLETYFMAQHLDSFCTWFVSEKVCLFCTWWSECSLHVRSHLFFVLFGCYTCLLYFLVYFFNYWKTYVSFPLLRIVLFPLAGLPVFNNVFFSFLEFWLLLYFQIFCQKYFLFLFFSIFFSILIIPFNKVCFWKLHHLGLFWVCCCCLLLLLIFLS